MHCKSLELRGKENRDEAKIYGVGSYARQHLREGKKKEVSRAQ